MCGLKIIESGQGPRFVDFLQFLKQRATLVNNEFGEDLNCSPSKDKEKSKAEMSESTSSQVYNNGSWRMQ